MLLAAFAALACLGCAVGAPAATPISDAAALLEALAGLPGSGNTTLLLQQSVALSPADAAGYQLPFSIAPGETVRLQGAGGTPMLSLEFGEIPLLLDVLGGGSLVLENLNISGTASQDDPVPGSNTSIQLLAVWPTITGEPGATVEMRGVNITLHPSLRCSAENVAGVVQQLKLAALPGSASASASGLTAYFKDFALPIPILNATGDVDGAIAFRADATNMTCQTAEAAPPAPVSLPADAGGGSLSGGAIAGIAIGAAAGAVLLVCAALWMLRRRGQRRRAAGADHLDEEAHHAGEFASTGGKVSTGEQGSGGSPRKAQAGHGSGSAAGSVASLGSPLGSGALQPRGGLFQSRVGAIEGLQLGGILGRGAFGHVYKGRWKGTQVAVKIVPMQVASGEVVDLEHEPLLSLSLSHPNVLAAYKMCVVRLQREGEGGGANAGGECAWAGGPASPGAAAAPAGAAAAAAGHGSAAAGASGSSSGGQHSRSLLTSSTGGSALGSGSTGAGTGQLVPSLTNKSVLVEVMPPQAVLEPGLYETWLVSELADGGSLADAIVAGRFASDLEAALLCLLDIARGLEYLHGCNILHGDLKPQNVLLRAARSDRRGYVCKLCDFGLSRLLSDHQTSLLTAHFGTVSHAAPELLQQGRLTRSSDVFAFGVVMWEMVSGQRPFKGMAPMQIICLTTQDGYRLPIPEHCPPELAALMQRCWDGDPERRPAAAAVVEEIIKIGSRLPRSSQAPPAPGDSKA